MQIATLYLYSWLTRPIWSRFGGVAHPLPGCCRRAFVCSAGNEFCFSVGPLGHPEEIPPLTIFSRGRDLGIEMVVPVSSD